MNRRGLVEKVVDTAKDVLKGRQAGLARRLR